MYGSTSEYQRNTQSLTSKRSMKVWFVGHANVGRWPHNEMAVGTALLTVDGA